MATSCTNLCYISLTVTREEIKQTILQILGRHLELGEYEVFLFGSRANGYNRQWSDYDVGVRGPSQINHRTMAKINLDLDESDLPIKVDVIDFSQTSARFEEIAGQHIETWYQPS